MTLAVTHCPSCKELDLPVKLVTKDSRAHFEYGFRTVKRRRICLKCNFKITTIELPITVGNEVFGE